MVHEVSNKVKTQYCIVRAQKDKGINNGTHYRTKVTKPIISMNLWALIKKKKKDKRKQKQNKCLVMYQ